MIFQTADINHSLTSIGIYWKVGDYIRRYVEKGAGGPPDTDFVDQMRKNLTKELTSLGLDDVYIKLYFIETTSQKLCN